MTADHSLPSLLGGTGVGKPLRRLEDLRPLTGRGCYSDDVKLPGQVYAVVVRSPHAHARIAAIGAERALAMSGVLAVLTGADYLADGLRPTTNCQVRSDADHQYV